MAANPSALHAAIDEMSANAKATFVGMDQERVRKFIEAQPEVKGPVAMTAWDYLTTGAGASNGIIFIEAELDRGAGRKTEQLVLRYQSGFQFFAQKSYSDEFLTQRTAAEAELAVPKALWLDADGSQIGRAGFISERVKGSNPAFDFMNKGPIAEATPQVRRAMFLETAAFHGRLRALSLDAPHLAKRGEGKTPIERELSWWRREAALSADEGNPHLEQLLRAYAWMIDNQPAAYPAGLVHGDSQLANVMYHDGRISAVIDWELSYLGHNETDLALIVYFAQWGRVDDGGANGVPSEAEFIAAFERESGQGVQHWPYFKAFLRIRAATATFCGRSKMTAFPTVWASQYDALQSAIAEVGKG